MHDDVEVLPLTPTLGAEITGIDIRLMNRPQFEALHRYWLEYKVFFYAIRMGYASPARLILNQQPCTT
jgi:alpha-ketoglutarate-dependent taurine dioxygenase